MLIRQGSGFLPEDVAISRYNTFKKQIAEGKLKAAVPNSKAKGGGDIDAWRNIVALHKAGRTSLADLAAMVNTASGSSGPPTLSQPVASSFSDFSDSDSELPP